MKLYKSIEKIEADFEKIFPIKTKLLDHSESIERINNETFSEHIYDLNNIWMEHAAYGVIDSEMIVRDRIQNEIKVIKGILEDIGGVAELLYRIENFNKGLGSSRRY